MRVGQWIKFVEHSWIVPLFSFLFWTTCLLGLLLLWLVEDRHEGYRPSDASFVYISNVGGAHKEFFIAFCVLTSVFYVASLAIERYLRHTRQLPGMIGKRRSTVLGVGGLIFGVGGATALIALAIKDMYNHSAVHWGFALAFIFCIAVSATCQTAQVMWLERTNVNNSMLRKSAICKLVIVVSAIAGALVFGGTYAGCTGSKPDEPLDRRCNILTSIAAGFEWGIAFLYDVYLLSLIIDLWPAVIKIGYYREKNIDLEKAISNSNSENEATLRESPLSKKSPTCNTRGEIPFTPSTVYTNNENGKLTDSPSSTSSTPRRPFRDSSETSRNNAPSTPNCKSGDEAMSINMVPPLNNSTTAAAQFAPVLPFPRFDNESDSTTNNLDPRNTEVNKPHNSAIDTEFSPIQNEAYRVPKFSFDSTHSSPLPLLTSVRTSKLSGNDGRLQTVEPEARSHTPTTYAYGASSTIGTETDHEPSIYGSCTSSLRSPSQQGWQHSSGSNAHMDWTDEDKDVRRRWSSEFDQKTLNEADLEGGLGPVLSRVPTRGVQEL